MGLDMYLSVRRTTYLKKGQRTIDLDDISDKFDDYETDEFGCSNRVEVSEQVGYWRKANAIHKWFVDNVQGGEDECQESYVDDSKLNTLLEVCNTVLDKIKGLEFVIDPKTKEWYDKENAAAKEKGDKIPYVYKDKFIFHKKNLKKFYENGWNYQCTLTNDAEQYIKDNLPPSEGFFFGSTEIDGGYFYDVVKTILILNRLKKKMNAWKKNKVFADVYYQASW